MQLTHGSQYADSAPNWTLADSTTVNYYRSTIVASGRHRKYGKPLLWGVGVDGSSNTPLREPVVAQRYQERSAYILNLASWRYIVWNPI
jgi:hypothetical protein